MKHIIFFIAIVSLILFSCTRPYSIDAVPTNLEGNWRMVMVKDNSSGITTTNPAGVQGNVDLTFTATNDTSGIFYGHTPTNEISQSSYSTRTNHQLAIPSLGMTQVAETPWGNEFVANICSAQEYSFDGNGKLLIKTTNKTLSFKRR